MTAFEFLGFRHTAVELTVFAAGWTLGWLLVWRVRHLPARPDTVTDRPSVAVVVPARNEAASLPHLLPRLVAQLLPDDELVVVDDHSDDGTADCARSFGATVVEPPPLPSGWLGKPHACHQGVGATSAPLLVFLDADVRPGDHLLADLAAAVTDTPDALVSVQPWHEMPSAVERASVLFNITALMGCGAFSVLAPRGAATVAFGPVLAIDRSTYERCGGHADPMVRRMHTEDIGLAQAVGESRLFVGRRHDTTFRMYPEGLRELLSGWTRSIATGARYTPWWLAVATAAWVASLAGGWLAAPLVYPLSALQVWVIGRKAGSVGPVTALAYPVLVLAFAAVFLRSTVLLLFRRNVRWKGRSVAARPLSDVDDGAPAD